ncbi:MAG TPA: hypothetical protein VGM10_31125 [Actinocrinis sp.]|jgi:hypothetical protein
MTPIVQTNGSHVTHHPEHNGHAHLSTARAEHDEVCALPSGGGTLMSISPRMRELERESCDAEFADQFVDHRIAEFDVARPGRGDALAAIDAIVWDEHLEPYLRVRVALKAINISNAVLDQISTGPTAKVAAYTLLATVYFQYDEYEETVLWLKRALDVQYDSDSPVKARDCGKLAQILRDAAASR